MKDERKTKKELINELQALRRRISWLEEKADSNISKKLAEKEKYYRLLLNSLHEDIMVIDREYRIVDMNNTFQSTTGQRREDVIGRYCYQVSHGYNRPCDMKGEECPLRTVFDTDETEHCVHQHTRQDGSKIWADLLFSPLKDEKGKVTHVIESARDITAHKEAEGTLSKSEERYRELVEKAGIAIMIDDLQGNFSYFNKQFCKLFGYREAEMRTKSIQTVVHPEDLERVESYHKGRLEGKKVPSRYEFKGIRKDGRTIYLEVEAVALKENGKVVGSRYYMWDITERKQAELALQVSEARFKTLFQEMPDAVFLSRIGGNNPGEILEVNPAAQLQTGYSGDELIGMNIVEDLSIDQNKVKLLPRREQSLDEGNSVRFTEKKRRKDGTEYWTEVLISKINFGDEQIALSVNRDITERIKAEEQIKQLQEYLQLQIDHMPIGLIVWDTEFRVQTWNPAAERIFGFTAEETLGRHPYDLIVPKEAQPLVENIWRRLIEGDTTAHSTNENVTKDRRTIICKWSNTPLKRNDGTVMGVLSMIQDITERKRAELELQESEERFRSVVENSHDGILIVDDTYTILYANRQLCSILGRSKKELLGHDFREFLDGENRRLVAEHYRRRQLGERVPSRYEFPVIRKDGEERLVEMKVAVIQDAQGRANTIAHLLDITAARKGETALKESQQQFKTLFESAPDAYYLHDLDGVFLSANAAAENLTGYRREELIGKSFPESGLLSGEQIPGALEILAKTRQGHAAGPAEFIFTRKDGQPVPVEIRTVLSKFREKPVVLGIARDISERKQAEAEHARLASVIDQASESVVITDLDGNIEYVNPAFVKLTGYSREEVRGKNPRILKSGEHDEAFYRELWETITGGNTWRGILINRRKDGSTYFEDAIIAPVKDESGKIINYAGMKRDITREKKLEDQLRQAQKMEAIGRLAGGVAHDFNNLLTVINGYSELLLRKLEPAAPFYKEITQISKAGERASHLTDQLLAFSRRQVIQPKVLNLNLVVADSVKMLRRLIGEDIDLAPVLDPDLGNVKIDPVQIEQIILNLAVNARDAMPQGGKLTIETSNFEIDDRYLKEHVEIQKGWYVMLAVSDTGIGMSKEIQNHIFEPFFTTKEHGKGTGLGLSTVYGIVKQNNGYVWVYSEPGEGTTFKIYLPVIKEAVSVSNEPDISLDALRGEETVLLVEDERNVRRLAKRILSENGYSVLEAKDGFQALQVSRKHKGKIHLLLTDVVMPSMSGKELAEKIEILHRGIKVVFFSGYTDNAIVHHRVLEPGTAFIQKPFTPLHLLKKIREVLDRE